MRNHLSKFASVYLWLAYTLWIVINAVLQKETLTPLNWCATPLCFLFGIYRLSEAKMDLDLQRLQEVDSET